MMNPVRVKAIENGVAHLFGALYDCAKEEGFDIAAMNIDIIIKMLEEDRAKYERLHAMNIRYFRSRV